MGGLESPDLGLHDGDSADMSDIPRLFDNREVPEAEIFGGEGENAGAGTECEIEEGFNLQRSQLGLEELHDPECSTEGLDEELDTQLDELS